MVLCELRMTKDVCINYEGKVYRFALAKLSEIRELHEPAPAMYKNPEEKRIAEAEQAAEQQYIDNLTVFDALKFAQACLWEKAETYEELAKKQGAISVFKNCLGEVHRATRIIDKLLICELADSEEIPCSNYDPRMCNAPCGCVGCPIQRDNDLTRPRKEKNMVKA